MKKDIIEIQTHIRYVVLVNTVRKFLLTFCIHLLFSRIVPMCVVMCIDNNTFNKYPISDWISRNINKLMKQYTRKEKTQSKILAALCPKMWKLFKSLWHKTWYTHIPTSTLTRRHIHDIIIGFVCFNCLYIPIRIDEYKYIHLCTWTRKHYVLYGTHNSNGNSICPKAAKSV